MRLTVISLALLAPSLAGGAWWGARAFDRRERLATALEVARSELTLRNEHIAFYTRRVSEHPSAGDLAQLAGLYLQRARETGQLRDYTLAEQTARRSLELRRGRNGKAQLTLASALLARHRFVEALDAARTLVASEPDVPAYRALLGEIQLEMGDYDAAGTTFDALVAAKRQLAVGPRLARWAEIRGQPEEARRILRLAMSDARARPDLPNEQLAWFYLRVGDLELRHERLRAAEDAFRGGLEVRPRDERLLGGMAKVAAARQEWRRVIEYALRVGDRADIALLSLAGDAHAALGDTVAAERWWRLAEMSGRAQPEPFNRQWTLFRLDHRRQLPETLALLRQEIRVRKDVYGYDQLAWALYLSGEYGEARDAMAQARRMGTRDRVLLEHAKAIDAKLR